MKIKNRKKRRKKKNRVFIQTNKNIGIETICFDTARLQDEFDWLNRENNCLNKIRCSSLYLRSPPVLI